MYVNSKFFLQNVNFSSAPLHTSHEEIVYKPFQNARAVDYEWRSVFDFSTNFTIIITLYTRHKHWNINHNNGTTRILQLYTPRFYWRCPAAVSNRTSGRTTDKTDSTGNAGSRIIFFILITITHAVVLISRYQ